MTVFLPMQEPVPLEDEMIQRVTKLVEKPFDQAEVESFIPEAAALCDASDAIGRMGGDAA